MALSYDLLSQFAKIVNTKPKTSTESTVYGKVVEAEDGTKYVQPDGSEQLIPVEDANVDSKSNDRVSVLIKDHTATVTGNMSSPATSIHTVEYKTRVLAEEIQAEIARVNTLVADKIDAGQLDAAKAEIAELYAQKAVVEELSADVISVTQIAAKKLDAEIANATFATIDNLDAIDADISNLAAAHGRFEQATATNFKAANAEINNLKAKDAEIENLVAEKASIKDLEAANAAIENLEADKANIKDLEATNAAIESLDTKYADIDFANIGEAALKKLFSDTGIIKDIIVSSGKITGELVGVTLKGDLIEAGTLKVDRLVVKGSDGNYYKLNTDFTAMPGVEPVEEEAIHGSVLVAKSITAEKVAVDDLVAFGAKIGGFTITNNSIYSGVKESATSPINGLYMDSEGQLSLGDDDNYLRYYKDSNNNYKLEISTVDKMTIGGRNLIRNSTTLNFIDYGFADAVVEVDNAILGTAILGNMILGRGY